MTETGSGGGTRRLAIILFADVAGYSRLMRADEEQTLTDLQRPPRRAGRRRWSSGSTAASSSRGRRCDGRVRQRRRGGTLGSRAAARHGRAQCRQAGRPATELPHRPASRRRHRSDEDVFGDTVNVAARLHALAEPGAIVLLPRCTSRCATRSVCRSAISAPGRSRTSTVRCVPISSLDSETPVRRARQRWILSALAAALLLGVVGVGAFPWSRIEPTRRTRSLPPTASRSPCCCSPTRAAMPRRTTSPTA